MITLYHMPKTRSSRFVWLLEEIGQPYELEVVGPDKRGADYKRTVHPHGKVPAISHDGTIVFESAAIALYLADAFPAANLGPRIGDPARGAFVTLLAYYAGVVEPAFVNKALGFTTTNSTTGWAPTEDVLAHLTGRLERASFLAGDRFTTVDILYGSTFALFKGGKLMPPNPVIEAYVERLVARPAYARAAARDQG